VDPVPEKSGSAGDRTRDLCICSQKLWPLDHRGGRIWILKVKLPSTLCRASVKSFVSATVQFREFLFGRKMTASGQSQEPFRQECSSRKGRVWTPKCGTDKVILNRRPGVQSTWPTGASLFQTFYLMRYASHNSLINLKIVRIVLLVRIISTTHIIWYHRGKVKQQHT